MCNLDRAKGIATSTPSLNLQCHKSLTTVVDVITAPCSLIKPPYYLFYVHTCSLAK